MKNCINCGAPLCGTRCEYCGTEYFEDRCKINADFSEDDVSGVLRINGIDYSVYLGHMEATPLYPETAGRCMDGKLYRGKPVLKHKFILIEQ